MKNQSIIEFQQKIQDGETFNILDVREIDEFNLGHIEGARNLPLSQIEGLIDQLDSSKHYHVICQMGGRSLKASEYLAQQGFDVTNIIGGMSEWRGLLK